MSSDDKFVATVMIVFVMFLLLLPIILGVF